MATMPKKTRTPTEIKQKPLCRHVPSVIPTKSAIFSISKRQKQWEQKWKNMKTNLSQMENEMNENSNQNNNNNELDEDEEDYIKKKK